MAKIQDEIPGIAPYLYSKDAHRFGRHDSPRVRSSMARHVYKERWLALKLTPRKHAKNYLRAELARLGKEWILKNLDSHSGGLYRSIEIGPTCAGMSRTKIRSKVFKNTEVFSTLELIDEIEKERKQPSLL